MQKNKVNINASKVPSSVPPSSLHTFLKNNTDFPGLVITDHQRNYKNHYYNSVYDNASNIQYMFKNVSSDSDDGFSKQSIQYFIANVAETLGKTVYQLVTNKLYSGPKKASKVLVCEFLTSAKKFNKYILGG